MFLQPQIEIPLFPDLTSFRHIASCLSRQKHYGLLRELPTTSENKFFHQVAVDSQLELIANKLSYQQVVHIPRSLQAQNMYLTRYADLYIQLGKVL
jgi:hypothetical protein